MICPVCGTENPADYLYCQKCGTMRPGSSKAEEPTRVGGIPVPDELPTRMGAAPDSSMNVPPPEIKIPPVETPPSYASYPPPPPEKPKKSKLPWIILGVALVIACLILAIGAVLYFVVWNGQIPANLNIPFLSGGNSGSGTRIIIGFPNSRNESELYLIKTGDPIDKGTLFLEDVQPSSGYTYEWDGFVSIGSYNYAYGGFSPDSKHILTTYTDDDANFTAVYDIGDKESTVLLESDYPLYSYILPDQTSVFFWENRTNDWYTHLSRNWQEAERISKTTNSQISTDGTTLLTIDINSNYETTLTVLKFNDPENEITLINDEENIESYGISGDGSLVYYTVNDYENIQLFVVNAEDGEVVFESDEFDSGITFNVGFSEEGNALYALIENEDGELDLYALRLGELNLVTTSISVFAQFNKNGAFLSYITGEDLDDQTLYVYNMSSGEETEVMNGSNLSMVYFPDPERLIIGEADEGEYTIFSASVQGDDLMELYNDDDMTLNGIYAYKGLPLLFVIMNDEDYLTHIYITPINEETGYYLLEEWGSLSLSDLSPDNRTLLFFGQEDSGDDSVLYRIDLEEGAEPEELDDDADNGFMNAVFTANGKEVVYTVNTGTDLDEVEVRQVTLGNENEISVLYEEAFLQDVEWKDMYAFEYLYLYSSPYYGSSFCPGAQTVTLDNPVSGTLEAAETACYKIELAADQAIAISASSDSGADLYLNLYDQDGYYLYSDDDSGPDYDPMIRYTPYTAGRYFIEVTTYASTGGSYTLTVTEGAGSASLDNAVPLYEYQTINDAITYDDEIYVEELGLYTYGDMYYFDGTAGEYVVISCSGYSYGSSMDPQIYLFDSTMYNLTSDDDSGDSYDSQISYYLPSTGIYYLLVTDHYNYYGTENDYWYDLYLTK